MKYAFTFNVTDNAFVDSMLMVQENSYNLFTYLIVLAIFFILYRVYVFHSNDKEYSFNLALFAAIILSAMFYYMGIYINSTYSVSYELFSGTFLLTEIVVFIITYSIMRFNREMLNE